MSGGEGFLKSAIGMNQDKLLISDGNQYLHDAIIFIDKQKQPPYASTDKKQCLIRLILEVGIRINPRQAEL